MRLGVTSSFVIYQLSLHFIFCDLPTVPKLSEAMHKAPQL